MTVNPETIASLHRRAPAAASVQVPAAVAAATCAAAGCKSASPEKTSPVVLGEPVAALCYRLKVAPEARAGRKTFWEQGEQMSAAAEFLGCPHSFTGPGQMEGLARIEVLARWAPASTPAATAK
jgi:hypothetical protein